MGKALRSLRGSEARICLRSDVYHLEDARATFENNLCRILKEYRAAATARPKVFKLVGPGGQWWSDYNYKHATRKYQGPLGPWQCRVNDWEHYDVLLRLLRETTPTWSPY